MAKYKLIADANYKNKETHFWAIIEGTVLLSQS